MLLSSSAVVSAQDQVSQSSADQMAAADATDPEQDAVARPSSEANQATSEAGAGADIVVTGTRLQTGFAAPTPDPTSGEQGKRGEVRVDLGGGRHKKKKKN